MSAQEPEFIDITSEDLRSLKPTNDNDYKCAPSKKFEDWSCIPLESLAAMAEAFNTENPNAKIKLDNKYITTKPEKYKRYLLKQFKNKITKCKDQICWTKQSFVKRLDDKIKEDVQNNTFRPEGPSKGNKWLNTLDINKTCVQYESKHNDFKFLGALPRDFDKISEKNGNLGVPMMTESGEIVNLDFKDLYPKKTKIGVVFNLDKHDEPGSHWVALYSDFKKGECYFIDSYGIEPLPEIKALMDRIGNFMKNTVGIKNPIIKFSTKEHQQGGSECGVYSISFILRLLKGESFDSINEKRISDEKVNQCRNVYFASKS